MKKQSGHLIILIIIFIAAMAILPTNASAEFPYQEPEPIQVATKSIEPFVFIEPEGLSGFSIDLWQAIAENAGIDYDYLVVESVTDQLDSVTEGPAQVGMAAISMTEERERSIDYSLPYYNSGLQILVGESEGNLLTDSLGALLSPDLLKAVGALILLMIIAAHLIWLMERNKNPEFPSAYWPGVWEGFWWAAVTVTTVGYGDKTPIGKLGRLLGIAWMFAGLFIIANFTANVAAQMAVERLQGAIQGPEDLYGKRVATVQGSTAASWLEDNSLSHSRVATVEDAYLLLEQGETDAVVFDAPVLQYFATTEAGNQFHVTGPVFERENYGIIVPDGHPLRETINRSLLRLMENGTYNTLKAKWFGNETQS
ncbi:MAG: transporter substrate-binding domain-containing protein [Chloroflexota bacterium]|nr:transporter substrate-binding domain-containing protein [Chloroflexota bacterium]